MLIVGKDRNKIDICNGYSLKAVSYTHLDTVTVRIASIAPVKKKQPLDAPVVYESNASTVFTLGGAATLYGSGKGNYQNIELAAEVISMNLDSSTVHAYGIKVNVSPGIGSL